jgi:hypothetical protein
VARTTEEVLRDHLRCRQAGDLATDIVQNYAEDVVILTMEGVFRGADGIRQNSAELRGYFKDAKFSFPVVRTAGRFAFIEWRAETPDARSTDGSDSFVIENGRIVCQTVRYTVVRNSGRERPLFPPDGRHRMPSFESRVTRLNDMGSSRFRVEFIGDKGESVAVECVAPQTDGGEPSREQVIEAARRLAREVAEPGREAAPERTVASVASGLSRPVDETEARTHSSEGRDRGTE